jgi:S-(hydroxymethyl)glutathione dehydrogenase/alcohol dehydrogenase
MPAVICRSAGSCAVEDLELRPLGRRDVLVHIEASGICRSDVSLYDGSSGGELPVVLGHEGCGTVAAVGEDVARLRVGDRVVLAAVAPCGLCWACARGEPYLCAEVRRRSEPAFVESSGPVRGASGLGTLTDALVLDARTAVPVESDLPAEQLAVLGCAVVTGAGSVLNIAATRPGDRVLVIGAGGVGLAAIQAAATVGADVIAAVDPSAAARTVAKACGATHVADPSATTLDEELLTPTDGRGFDSALDCVGAASTFELAFRLTRRGGHVVMIGVAPPEVAVPVPLAQIPLSGRRISGCVYGGTSVHRDIPQYVAMAETGRIDLDQLVGRTIGLDEAPGVIVAGDIGPARTVVLNR